MLLVISSSLFFVPSILALYYSQQFYAWTSGLLGVLSLANHTKTIHPAWLIHNIDKVYSHIVAVTYLSLSFYGFYTTSHLLYICSSILGFTGIAIYKSKMKFSNYALKQATIHICISAAWICCIYAPSIL